MPCPLRSTASEPRDDARLNDLAIELVDIVFRIAPLVGIIDIPAPMAGKLVTDRGLVKVGVLQPRGARAQTRLVGVQMNEVGAKEQLAGDVVFEREVGQGAPPADRV